MMLLVIAMEYSKKKKTKENVNRNLLNSIINRGEECNSSLEKKNAIVIKDIITVIKKYEVLINKQKLKGYEQLFENADHSKLTFY